MLYKWWGDFVSNSMVYVLCCVYSERPTQEGNPEFQKQLTESSDLIKKLEKTQYERLSQQPDPNVITVVQPSEQEKQLG